MNDRLGAILIAVIAVTGVAFVASLALVLNVVLWVKVYRDFFA